MKLLHGKDNVPTFMAVLMNDRISCLVFHIKELGHSCLKVLSKPQRPVRITFIHTCCHKTTAFHKLNKELKKQ